MDTRKSLIASYERDLRNIWDRYRRRVTDRRDARNWFYFYNSLRRKVRNAN